MGECTKATTSFSKPLSYASAQVQCIRHCNSSFNFTATQIIHTYNTGEGDVRPVGGSGPHVGRVEVFHNGTWGAVCDDDWDLQDAMVVCRQLGYGTAVGALRRDGYGEGSGPIWYYNVDCSGSEANLAQCDLYYYYHDYPVPFCGHWRDAGVICASE